MKTVAKWRCRDGRELSLSEMTTDHVRNALAMLRRKGFGSFDDWQLALNALGSGMMGEHAQDALLAEVTSFRVSPWIDAFEAELKRRDVA